MIFCNEARAPSTSATSLSCQSASCVNAAKTWRGGAVSFLQKLFRAISAPEPFGAPGVEASCFAQRFLDDVPSESVQDFKVEFGDFPRIVSLSVIGDDCCLLFRIDRGFPACHAYPPFRGRGEILSRGYYK